MAEHSNIAWNPIPGFPRYDVSSDGEIRSRCGRISRLLKPTPGRYNHLYVFLYIGGKATKMYIHRAVLLAFKGQPPEGHEGRHLDGVPTNNRLDNLAWGTRQENSDDTGRHGHRASGERSGTHILTEKDVWEIDKRIGKETTRALGKVFGVSHTAIRRAASRLDWAYLPKEASGG